MKRQSIKTANSLGGDAAEEWPHGEQIKVATLGASAQAEYVAWIDLMGATDWMAGSIRRAAEIIGLIHIAAMKAAANNSIKVYPVIDGVYLVGTEKGGFKSATGAVMRTLATAFLRRPERDRFLVRGGIAFGRVLHGEDVARLHVDLRNQPKYTSCLAIGVSVVQAYAAEKKAPPFGYYVDMTARATAPIDSSPYISAFYRWWSPTKESAEAEAFGHVLDAHFGQLLRRSREVDYQLDRIKEHRLLAGQYFRIDSESEDRSSS